MPPPAPRRACRRAARGPSRARVPTRRGRKYVPPESGIEPDLAERLDEARRLRRDHDVAGEREVGAGAGGDAVDRADDRHRQRAQRQHQRLVVALDRRAEVDGRAAGRDRAVAPGPARRRSRGRRRSAAARAPTRRPSTRAERVAHLGVHRVVEAVEPVGPVERQPRDAAVDGEQDRARSSCVAPRDRPTNAARRQTCRDAGRRGSGWRRTRRRSAPRWPPDWRRCRGSRRTPPTG